jgi:hypothetical protein
VGAARWCAPSNAVSTRPMVPLPPRFGPTMRNTFCSVVSPPSVRENHRAQRVDHVVDFPARRGERHEYVRGMAILRVLEEPIGRSVRTSRRSVSASACRPVIEVAAMVPKGEPVVWQAVQRLHQLARHGHRKRGCGHDTNVRAGVGLPANPSR